MFLCAGTSGFSYPSWKGVFYEKSLPEARMLEAYAQKLPSVEINNTFYRLPKPSLLEGWAGRVPATFSFAIKAPRRITHSAKLKNVEAPFQELLAAVRMLEGKLGPILFQLPPILKKDTALLADFCQTLPKDIRAAFEFRHASWFSDDTYAVLSDCGAALTAAEVDPDEGTGAPYVRTADFTYVRLRRASYEPAELERALMQIERLDVERAYVYMKHEVLGPSYAMTLLSRARAKHG
jgi:uncharacterized protein YecE (DUF72 family)